MANSNNPYLLPKRAPLASGDDTFEPKRFKQLIERLPIGNTGQISQSLHHLLKQMNASVIPVSDRVSDLEMILRPLMVALESLEQGFVRESLPLNKRASMLSEMHQSLCILAVQAYKVILDQYHHETFTGQLLHKTSRAMALHRVLYFLGCNLLHAYQLYRPAPTYIWQEIHGIHRYAFDQKLADRPVDNEDQSLYRHSTVNNLYKRLLLLSLAGPYRLMQGEAVRVYQVLSHWASEVQLLDLGKTNGDVGPFIVDIGIDEAPRYKGAERDHQVRRGWVLDTSDLAIKLAAELESTAALHGAMRPQDASDKVSPDLLARLMLTWGIGSQRVAERDETQGEVELFCGLEAVYRELGGEAMPASVTKPGAFNHQEDDVEKQTGGIPRALLEADEYVINDDPQLMSIRRWVAENNAPAIQPRRIVTPAKKPAAPPPPTQPVSRNCPVYNESGSGYHLGWSVGAEQSISVGELVAVSHRDTGSVESLRLGVIRWMRVERPDVIDFGLELIPGDLLPVIFFRQWGRGRQEGYYPGLLLQRPNEDPTVITLPFYSEPGERTWLMAQGEKRPILLSREIEATASFIQFYFSDPAQPKRQDVTNQIDETDFEKLWTSL